MNRNYVLIRIWDHVNFLKLLQFVIFLFWILFCHLSKHFISNYAYYRHDFKKPR